MHADYILACGVVWQKTADPEAGWELVGALESTDPSLRELAQRLLAQSGEISMGLIEEALVNGVVNSDRAGPCMAEILRSRQGRQMPAAKMNGLCANASLHRDLTHLD